MHIINSIRIKALIAPLFTGRSKYMKLIWLVPSYVALKWLAQLTI